MLRFTLDARERYAEEDYEGVVTRLQPLISHSDMSAFAKTLEEQHESLELLAKACIQVIKYYFFDDLANFKLLVLCQAWPT
jgi:hypothetical protein